jgi:Fur family ferric uptake transcriptional regulator
MPFRKLQRRSLMEDFRARRVRVTAQRRALIETIQEAGAHLDAATLLERARQRNASVDRATVYRTLELLKKLGRIDELDLMHLNGEKHYYEAKTTSDHTHLACFRCGKIVEFASEVYEELKAEMERTTGFRIQVSRFEAGGLCKACRVEDATGKRRASVKSPE